MKHIRCLLEKAAVATSTTVAATTTAAFKLKQFFFLNLFYIFQFPISNDY